MSKSLFGILTLVIVISTCRLPDSGGSLKDFNAKTTVIAFDIEGQVKLPKLSSEEISRINQWNNVERFVRHNSQKPEADLLGYIDNVLSTNHLPEQWNHQLELTPIGAIKEQLKYAVRVGETKVPLSVNTESIRYKTRGELITYTATITLNPTSNTIRYGLSEQDLIFPIDPFRIFFKVNKYESIKDILKTRKATHKLDCHKPDGDPIAPHSYFYYLNPYVDSECRKTYKNEFIPVKKLKSYELPPRDVWPEYDLLYQDEALDIVVAFGPGNVSSGAARGPINYRDINKSLRRQGYKVVKKISDTDLIQSKTFESGLKVKIRTILVRDASEVSKALALENGYANELIFYSGHSDYGNSLNEALASKNFPENHYQVFGLFSCSSYEYGKSNVLASKAIIDFDTNYQYVDLLTTAHSLLFMTMVPVMNETIKFFTEAYTAHKKQEKLENYTYLALLKRMDNKDAKGENAAVFTITGEEENVYRPKMGPRQPSSSNTQNLARFENLLHQLIIVKDASEETKIGFVNKAIQKNKDLTFPILLNFLKKSSQESQGHILQGMVKSKTAHPSSFLPEILTLTDKSDNENTLQHYYTVLNQHHITAPINEKRFIDAINGKLGPQHQRAALYGVYLTEKTTPAIFNTMVSNLNPKANDKLFDALEYTIDENQELAKNIITRFQGLDVKKHVEYFYSGAKLLKYIAERDEEASRAIKPIMFQTFMADGGAPYLRREIAYYLSLQPLTPQERAALQPVLLRLLANKELNSYQRGTYALLLAKANPTNDRQLKSHLLIAARTAEDDTDKRIAYQAIESLDTQDTELIALRDNLKRQVGY